MTVIIVIRPLATRYSSATRTSLDIAVRYLPKAAGGVAFLDTPGTRDLRLCRLYCTHALARGRSTLPLDEALGVAPWTEAYWAAPAAARGHVAALDRPSTVCVPVGRRSAAG